MIITGDHAKLLPKDTPNRAFNGGNSRAGDSSDPPSYQATPAPFQPHVQGQPQVVLQPVIYHRSPARRFWLAFLTAILVWVLVTALIRSWFSVIVHWSDSFRKGEFPAPAGVSLSHCVIGEEDWSHLPYPSSFPPFPESESGRDSTNNDHFPYSSSTIFELPLSYRTLFLMAQGTNTYGTVNIITSEETSDVVKVYLTIKYIDRDARDQGIKVCLLRRDQDAIGVGYFTRQWYYPSRYSVYEATVVIPASRNHDSLCHIENFETDMSNTIYWLGDLRLVNFSRISIKGSNSPIYSKSLLADIAVFRTSNGALTGSYNASRSLTLRTSNAPIRADVRIANEKDYVSDLTLHTSNSKIDTRVHLTSETPAGRFMVTATTSNAPLTVAFPSSPVDSTLRLSASTSNGHALLSLHPTYEGQFSMTTSNDRPWIRPHDVADPSGKGRVRQVLTTSLGHNTLSGRVSWSNVEGPGRVELRSSNAAVVIEL
ncbi:hypothetical protein E4T56_gene816 [Termitomyces sp. T112]|nr:hypothetical protein E4T56_gene816 [Termitomyces sp. T112]